MSASIFFTVGSQVDNTVGGCQVEQVHTLGDAAGYIQKVALLGLGSEEGAAWVTETGWRRFLVIEEEERLVSAVEKLSECQIGPPTRPPN